MRAAPAKCYQSNAAAPIAGNLETSTATTFAQRASATQKNSPCALQDLAAVLVPALHVQQVIHKQGQLQRRTAQHPSHGLDTVQLLHVALGFLLDF